MVLTMEEIAADEELWEACGAAMHLDRYPEGCHIQGHRCEMCATVYGDIPHRFGTIGRRPGYKGYVVCLEPTCPDYRRMT